MAKTLEEIRAIPHEMLIPEDVADFLETNPQSIRTQANTDADKLGFPVIVVGSRVKIPKEAFLNYMKYGKQNTIVRFLKTRKSVIKVQTEKCVPQ